ncbi:MAG: diaminopimelate decarboxylase [Candidatus Omnitrophica bacterium]|nr:diaminopimelate decarboxylase [Candidatus Omnitrophota bacterium]
MHDFYYNGKELYCEGVAVKDIAAEVGTPFYLYSHKTLTDHYTKLAKAFKSVKPLICFSMKANSNLAVLKSLVKAGAGLDIVSGGELFRALKVGVDPKKIVYAGVGKTRQEIQDAIKAGILLFNVESTGELVAINEIAGKLKKKVNVSLRINPDIDASTHSYVTTGKKESKFGIDLNTAEAVFLDRARYHHIDLCGIHVHIGSQITVSEPFVKAFRKVLIFMMQLEKHGTKIKFLNFGGGLGIIYSDEKPQTADEFAEKILPLLKGSKFQVVFEPGRFICGNAGIFVTRVLYPKKTQAKNFIVVDGAMNDLIRPSLYDAHHDVLAVTKNEVLKRIKADVVGPVCESGDFLAKDRNIPDFQAGDLIALMGAGAYGFTMSSNYNSRPRVPEVMVSGSKFEIVRKRESVADLIKGETIPSFLK